MDQPLRDPFSVADHTTLLWIAHPNLRVLVHFMARNRIREANGPWMAVSLLDKALAPAYPIFVSLMSHPRLLKANSLFAQELLIDEFRAGRLSPTITHIFFNFVQALITPLPPEMRNPTWLNHLLPESLDHASILSLTCNGF
jgi:hypothetical protein